MMEKLGFPQTHLGLKAMIKEVVCTSANIFEEQNNSLACCAMFVYVMRFCWVLVFAVIQDEDNDEKIAYREFLLIFRYAKNGTLKSEGLKAIAANVDVEKEGVGGAKNFFEAKAKALNDNPAERDRAHHEAVCLLFQFMRALEIAVVVTE